MGNENAESQPPVKAELVTGTYTITQPIQVVVSDRDFVPIVNMGTMYRTLYENATLLCLQTEELENIGLKGVCQVQGVKRWNPKNYVIINQGHLDSGKIILNK